MSETEKLLPVEQPRLVRRAVFEVDAATRDGHKYHVEGWVDYPKGSQPFQATEACGDASHRLCCDFGAAENYKARKNKIEIHPMDTPGWRKMPPTRPGWWAEWDSYKVTMWEVSGREGSAEMWIYWNGFWRMCSSCLQDSQWMEICLPNKEIGGA